MPRPYTDLSNPPRLGCRVGVRCVPLRGVVGIIVTGRGIVRWSCLQTGRGMPRPYTDLSNPPRLGCRVGARFVSLQGVVVHESALHLGGAAFRPCPIFAVIPPGSGRWAPESADFAVAGGRNQTFPMKRPCRPYRADRAYPCRGDALRRPVRSVTPTASTFPSPPASIAGNWALPPV